MNFSDFCESLSDPLYVEEDKVQCKPGFKYDKKLGKCVPAANMKTTSSQNEGDKLLPDPLGGWDTWGATGIDGDGYAMEEETDTSKRPSIKDEKKKKKTNVKHYDGLGIAPTVKEALMYHPTEKDRKRYDKQDAEHKAQDDRMRYGKTSKAPEKPLRRGEVRRWDKVQKKWVSNK